MLSGADESFTPHQSKAPKTMKPRIRSGAASNMPATKDPRNLDAQNSKVEQYHSC